MFAGSSLPQPAKAWTSSSAFEMLTCPPVVDHHAGPSSWLCVPRDRAPTTPCERRRPTSSRGAGLPGGPPTVGGDRSHADQRPLGGQPVGETPLRDLLAEDELARRLGGRGAGIETLAGGLVEPAPVVDQAPHLVGAANRAVSRGRSARRRAPSRRSSAAIQPSSGPAHMIGVTPMKRMSAAIATFASGTQTIRSPGRVRGADLDQADLAAADLELKFSRERAGRRHQPHLVEARMAPAPRSRRRRSRRRRRGADTGTGSDPARRRARSQGAEALHLGRGLGLHHRPRGPRWR